ncbi:MAG: hypothetical protein M1838_000684 [Thelocarpon superellum]|nr:MAG: hypothetical protein M1838_000684 [Thelocarpon superellum]
MSTLAEGSHLGQAQARPTSSRDLKTPANGLRFAASPGNDPITSCLPQHQDDAPSLFHRIRHNRSILSLAVSEQSLFAGTQGGDILVWSLETSILTRPQIWCPKTLQRLYSIYSTYDVGDVFCVAYASSVRTAYFGAQNTSIQWYDLGQKDSRPPPNPIHHPSHRNHRFFDSVGPGGLSTPRPTSSGETSPRDYGGRDLEIDKDHIFQYAHYGYVYCMLLARGLGKSALDEETLISGGGDGTIKLWALDADDGAISEIDVLESGDQSVLCMALDGTILYSGMLEGDVNVWDLDTRQLVRTVKAHPEDVLTLSIGGGSIFSGGAKGVARTFNQRYECTSCWEAHAGLILASSITTYHGRRLFITGGNDDCVAIWDVGDSDVSAGKDSQTSNEQLLGSLSKLVSYRTVSCDSQYAEDCRRGATYLRMLFKRFGATTEMLNTEGNLNPIVFARFHGHAEDPVRRKKILFYGHYDVIAAENDEDKWIADPFRMEPINGFLYGRGTSDNKGPILAALYAAAELLREDALLSDILFLVEGEEECGSRGFADAVRKNKQMIGDVDYIILANSYWLDDEVPCLTYGLRGVIHASVSVESDRPDLHSGVDGSSRMDEALKDLVTLLAQLSGPRGRIKIPAFYDPILPISRVERQRYDAITRSLLGRNPTLADPETLATSLMQKWRDPSLTIHRFEVSGPENSTIIPRLARASLSIRLVPNQESSAVKKVLIDYLETCFAQLDSQNHLSISIDHEADPWLGDPDNEVFQTLEEAIVEVWGESLSSRTSPNSSRSSSPTPLSTSTATAPTSSSPPFPSPSSPSSRKPPKSKSNSKSKSKSKKQEVLYIREGGSIPSIRFLEKEFDAPAAHLPCGQASDNAHLNNERLRLTNLYCSRRIFKSVFRRLH